METEAHVYALAVAASVLLAFYPFLMVMLSFCRDVMHMPAAQEAVTLALRDFFAGKAGLFLPEQAAVPYQFRQQRHRVIVQRVRRFDDGALDATIEFHVRPSPPHPYAIG